MAKHKFITMLQRRLRHTLKLCNRAIAKRLRKLLRPVFAAFNRRSNPRAGFVLPTAALLLLVVSLVVGAILIRTLNRTEQVVNERQEKVIYNAATPAIDRAKAKIEFLFNNDPRLPSGVPSEDVLWSMMLDDGSENTAPLGTDPYTLPGETRLEIGGQSANAWSFQSDSDGDGEDDTTIAYSIIWRLPAGSDAQDQIEQILDQTDDVLRSRAQALAVRNGPFASVAEAGCDIQGNAIPIEKGFFKDRQSSGILRKNFQIDAFAISNTDDRGTVTTLELQQDRQADRGNKFGALFRYDLEVAPGQEFKWNGAMQTDGSLLVGNRQFRGYLISSPKSCLYQAGSDTSAITSPSGQNSAFQGQMMSANLNGDNVVSRDNFFHLYGEDKATVDEKAGRGSVVEREKVRFSSDTDSVKAGIKPSQISLDPIKLFTTGESAYQSTLTPDAIRDENWSTTDFVKEERMVGNPSQTSFEIDDSYRADDRYGPSPVYDEKAGLSLQQLGTQNGDPISGQEKLTTFTPVAANLSADRTELGLDGYWERRAWREGMRVIVGQRLELGNDPLPTPVDYRGEDLNNTLRRANRNNAGREHETLQRRSLRDNLAAVQTTAIYHHASGPTDESDPPVAAIISTVHPGTSETLKRSSTFEQIDEFGTQGAGIFAGTFGDNPNEIPIDFFTGRGTNGWEIDFQNNYFTDANVQTALENLANFSGDDDGAFPPLQENGGNIIHPYPELTKWGNFSNLKRALGPDGNGSIADESYQHTASLTLGMLAYNLAYLEAYNYGNANNRRNHLNEIDAILEQTLTDPITGTARTDPDGLQLGATPEEYVAAIATAEPDLEDIARLLSLKEQTNRDRTFGFRASPTTLGEFKYTVQFLKDESASGGTDDSFTYGGIKYDALTADTPPSSGGSSPIETNHAYFTCDFSNTPGNGNNFFGFGPPANIATEQKFIRLATALCGVNEDTNGNGTLDNANEDLNDNQTLDSVKYPSLFYLFPKENHDRKGAGAIAQPTTPRTGDYAVDRYLTDNNIPNAQFVALEPLDIILQPKAIANWNLPVDRIGANPPPQCNNDATATNPNTNCGKLSLIYDGTDYYRLAFKDSAFFNGREMMNVRALNLDLELLKENETPNGDFWLAAGDDSESVQMEGGIVYAFREDAIREDAIARPQGGTCNSFQDFTNGNCRSDATDPIDPAVSGNGISPKPVDYYPDPDRRPDGFRLTNGEDISRDAAGGQTQYGITFVSDNPAYLQGDFNCHGFGSCNNPIEEFQTELPDGFTPQDFYRRTNLNDSFARAEEGDTWRFSEFLVDAMTLLSDNFCEGSLEDGFLIASPNVGNPTLPTELRSLGRSANANLSDVYGCANNREVYTSYTNQNRPQNPLTTNFEWLRENPADPASPIKISANGNPETYDPTDAAPLSTAIDYSGTYHQFTASFAGAGGDDQKPMNVATLQKVNAVIISGIVPSQAGQTYGGLHNFPRFIEDWLTGSQAAKISGSLMQFNFSTYATAPFDQDAWEPDLPAQLGGPIIHYYQAPQRLWGYDVALQYVQPGPITRRLVKPSPFRSEFYSELPLDDPYILNLRCSTDENGAIDPRAQENGEC
ncbi:hypothetical protein IQ235_00065 [Oscillatoriales cyanobacterium LEGE 11467]|uniref:Uncharacterized protein n=1 Tax=Zarconia navalis LEGE 11467 TaxID=1828826 RepID=A0A928Z7B1_9CYAN|nr:hormogonium polysaccharide biosynthesis protein HpsA [Zarconia navalis]MBE9039189.1 hypothetical protein [Zarconia navalis LEGE 11467]